MGAIAKRLGCSEANVWAAVQRDKISKGVATKPRPWQTRWMGRIAPLTEEHLKWIEAEAQRLGVQTSVIARSLLVDAIEDEIEKAATP